MSTYMYIYVYITLLSIYYIYLFIMAWVPHGGKAEQASCGRVNGRVNGAEGGAIYRPWWVGLRSGFVIFTRHSAAYLILRMYS